MMTDRDKMEYWERVEKALVLAGVAPGLAHELRNDVKELSEPQQELFYHAEPLDVARDLCGITQWSQQDIETYLDLQTHDANIDGRSLEVLEDRPFVTSIKLQREMTRIVEAEIERKKGLSLSNRMYRDSPLEMRFIFQHVESEITNTSRALGIVALLALVAIVFGSALLALGLSTAVFTVVISSLLSIVAVAVNVLVTKFGMSRSASDVSTHQETERKPHTP